MHFSLPSQSFLSEIHTFNAMNAVDSDESIKTALRTIFHLWSAVLSELNDPSDDELFSLNVSRAFLARFFAAAIAKDCFKTDQLFLRDIVRSSFDLLIRHQDVFSKQQSTFMIVFLTSNLRLIMQMSSSVLSFVSSSDLDLFHDDDQQLLKIMREHVDEDWTHDHLTDDIVSFVWNLSDNTILVPLLLDAGYGESLMGWIRASKQKFREDKRDASLFILQNILRHDDGFDLLKSYHVLQLLESSSDVGHPVDRSQLMALRVLLTDLDEIRRESTEYPSDFLQSLLQSTVNAASSDDFRHDGSHVGELLVVLTKLCHNDQILHQVLGQLETKPVSTAESIIELLTSLLIKFYSTMSDQSDPLENSACLLTLNLLRLISFHPPYRQFLGEQSALPSVLESAANNEKRFVDTCMPRTMTNMQQAAFDILGNLNEETSSDEYLVAVWNKKNRRHTAHQWDSLYLWSNFSRRRNKFGFCIRPRLVKVDALMERSLFSKQTIVLGKMLTLVLRPMSHPGWVFAAVGVSCMLSVKLYASFFPCWRVSFFFFSSFSCIRTSEKNGRQTGVSWRLGRKALRRTCKQNDSGNSGRRSTCQWREGTDGEADVTTITALWTATTKIIDKKPSWYDMSHVFSYIGSFGFRQSESVWWISIAGSSSSNDSLWDTFTSIGFHSSPHGWIPSRWTSCNVSDSF